MFEKIIKGTKLIERGSQHRLRSDQFLSQQYRTSPQSILSPHYTSGVPLSPYFHPLHGVDGAGVFPALGPMVQIHVFVFLFKRNSIHYWIQTESTTTL